MSDRDHDQPPAGDLGYLLTAYADGQLAPDGAAWVEAQLAQRPELRTRLDEIRALQAQLRERLQRLPIPVELDAGHRQAVLAAARRPRPSLRMPSLRWRFAAVAALLVCAVGGMLLPSVGLVRESARRSPSYRGEADDLPPLRTATVEKAGSAGDPLRLEFKSKLDSKVDKVGAANAAEFGYTAPAAAPAPATPAAPAVEPVVASNGRDKATVYDEAGGRDAPAAKLPRAWAGAGPGGGANAFDSERSDRGGADAPRQLAQQERRLESVDDLAAKDERSVGVIASGKPTAPAGGGEAFAAVVPLDGKKAAPAEQAAEAEGLAASDRGRLLPKPQAAAAAPAGAGELDHYRGATTSPAVPPPVVAPQAPPGRNGAVAFREELHRSLAPQDALAVRNGPLQDERRAEGQERQQDREQDKEKEMAERQGQAQKPGSEMGSTGGFFGTRTGGGKRRVVSRAGGSVALQAGAADATAAPTAQSAGKQLVEAAKGDELQEREQLLKDDEPAHAAPAGDGVARLKTAQHGAIAPGEPTAKDGDLRDGGGGKLANEELAKKEKDGGGESMGKRLGRILATGEETAGNEPALPDLRPDPRTAAAALGQAIALRADGTLAGVLHEVTGDQVGLSASSTVAGRLAQPAALAVTGMPRGQALLQLARGAGLQARLEGGTLGLDVPRAPLDPTDLQGLDRATFKRAFATQPMMPTAEDAQSTFALDADTASYERARALLRAGQAVDPATVQPEHFINAMPMDYPPAQGPEAFTLYAEAAPSPFAAPPVQSAWSAVPAAANAEAARQPAGIAAARTALVAVGAVARPAGADERRPLHLTLAIDCSGSMAQPGGLERIQAGLLTLIAHLRSDDRVGIVAFGDQARVVLPATAGSERERLTSAIAGLATGGSTNCAEGLGLAYQLAAESLQPGTESRVVLATDGATLSGTGAPAVVARVADYRQRGITLLVLGCGATAYQAEALEELANKGDGQHLFLGSDDEARAAFSSRLLPERLAVLAKDAKVQVTWNAQRVSHFRLIGYEKRRLAHQDFRNDAVDAGEISHDTQVTALYEVLLVDGASGPLGSAAVRYFDTRLQQVRELACPLPGSVLASQPSQRLRLLACAAEFAEWLQRGWWSNVHASSAPRLLAELKRCDLPMARELEELVQRAAAQNQNQNQKQKN